VLHDGQHRDGVEGPPLVGRVGRERAGQEPVAVALDGPFEGRVDEAEGQRVEAVPVDGLGKIGYELKIAATTKVGPAIEVGWLSGNDRLIVLRYTCAPGIAAEQVTAAATSMVTLAHAVDTTTV
jgi:hypothetical protein